MKVVRILLLALCANFALDGCTGCSKNPNLQNKLKAEGDACAKDDECESGVCDAVGDDAKTCLRTCNEGCDPTDVCTPLADADRYVCLPEKPGLCQTCQLDEDCPYPADRCLIIGGTKMCGRDCSNPQDGVQQCPSSYRCADATDANGGLVTKQCQPISGTCECTSASVGQTKPCSESNSYGTCMGQQTCQPPNGYTACSAPVPGAESCNGKDDDCNGQVDEGLGETSCGIGACRRTSANCINGQPATCMPGAPTVELCDGIDSNCDGIVDTDIAQAEICDGLDNDCDGLIDEDFTLASDVNNCGQCGNACGLPNANIATYACVASTCGIGTCSDGFANCDQSYATGCETDIANGITINGVLTNCGACNQVCTVIHGTATCVAGQCNVGVCDDDGVHHWQDCYPDSVDGGAGCETDTNVTVSDCATCGHACATRPNSTPVCSAADCSYTCLPTYFDVDGLPTNGCEYQCTVTNGGVDDPDDAYLDQNCDGIDGDISRAIFVSTGGNDSNPGTRNSPKRTLQNAIDTAFFSLSSSSPRPNVYAGSGTYNEAVSLRAGVSVFGGFNAATWKRNDTSGLETIVRNTTPTNDRIISVLGVNITVPSTIAYLTVSTGNAGTGSDGVGVSVYAMHCTNCTALTLRTVKISSGSGGNGSTGSAGTNGAGPTSTMNGLKGEGGSNDGESGGAGANGGYACAGGSLSGPGAGGRGGDGRNGGTAGNTGSWGYNSSGVAGTPAGYGGAGSGSNTCNPGQGQTGGNGGPGASGGAGGAGSGFVVSGGFIVAGAGTSGSSGGVGNGGGGGGGGGGQGDGSWFDGCDDGRGNGGGGGGGGGCAGTAGGGGKGGGGSFGLFLVNSNGLQIFSSQISSGTGGQGGNGGAGGAGGSGGSPGAGGNGASETGLGGPGGYGGRGGHGGGGGGGAGGPSYALYKVSSTITLDTASQNALAAGGGGLGGSGGVAQTGGNNGTQGVAGASAPSN